MKNKKTSLQELVLRHLRKQSASTTDSIVEAIEEELSSEKKERSVKPRYIIMRTIKHLSQNGFVELYKTNRSTFTRITPEGRQKLRTFNLTRSTSLVSPFWDGKWRVVIVDFPESRKDERDAITYLLKKAHFALLKNSVWISPHPMEYILSSLKNDLNLTQELVIIVTESIDPSTEERYLREFCLLES